MSTTNLGKSYRDRHNDERRITYWLRHHTDKLARVVSKVLNKVQK